MNNDLNTAEALNTDGTNTNANAPAASHAAKLTPLELLKRGSFDRIAFKKTLNLAARDDTSRPVLLIAAGFIVIAFLAFLAVRYGVIAQFARVAKAEADYQQVHELCSSLEKEAARFSEVRIEFLTYTSGWMNDVKDTKYAIGVDREDVLDLIDRVFVPYGEITSLSINSYQDKSHQLHDTLEISMRVDSMSTASSVLADVRNDPLCRNAVFNLAESNEIEENGNKNKNNIDLDIIGDQYDQYVRFSVTVELKKMGDDK